MNSFVNALKQRLNELGLFGILLRLTILLLPWQTRSFIEGPMMGGFAWEQGRLSLYATMLLMIVVIVLDRLKRMDFATSLLASEKRSDNRLPSVRKFLIGMALFVFLFFPTLSSVATLQGLVQILLIVLFGRVVLRTASFRSVFPFWFVISLLPVVGFTVLQTLFQAVPAMKWLGVAAQDPLVRGVSVIEVGTERFLRAYGSFPHPNVLGGWMMVGTLVAFREWVFRNTKPVLWLIASLGSLLALYLSFSRSALLACIAGMIVLFLVTVKDRTVRKKWLIGSFAMVAVVGIPVLIKPELIFTRLASTQRLETKSIHEREASIQQGLQIVRQYPFGTGFEAYRVGLDKVCTGSCVVPAEPPHILPLLALAELGWTKVLFLVGLGLGFVFTHRAKLSVGSLVFLIPLGIIAGLDHYLWSLWAGQALCLMFVLLISEQKGLVDG